MILVILYIKYWVAAFFASLVLVGGGSIKMRYWPSKEELKR